MGEQEQVHMQATVREVAAPGFESPAASGARADAYADGDWAPPAAQAEDSMHLSGGRASTSSDEDARGGGGSGSESERESGSDGEGGGDGGSGRDGGDGGDGAAEDASAGEGARLCGNTRLPTAARAAGGAAHAGDAGEAAGGEVDTPSSGDDAAPQPPPGHARSRAQQRALATAIPLLWAPPDGALLPLLSAGSRTFTRSDVRAALPPHVAALRDAVHGAVRRLVADGVLVLVSQTGHNAARYAPAGVGAGAEKGAEEEAAATVAAPYRDDARSVGGRDAAPCASVGDALADAIPPLWAAPGGRLRLILASRVRSFTRADVRDALPRHIVRRVGSSDRSVDRALRRLVAARVLALVAKATSRNPARFAPVAVIEERGGRAGAKAAAAAAAAAEEEEVEEEEEEAGDEAEGEADASEDARPPGDDGAAGAPPLLARPRCGAGCVPPTAVGALWRRPPPAPHLPLAILYARRRGGGHASSTAGLARRCARGAAEADGRRGLGSRSQGVGIVSGAIRPREA